MIMINIRDFEAIIVLVVVVVVVENLFPATVPKCPRGLISHLIGYNS
jgi:hypothetical protein